MPKDALKTSRCTNTKYTNTIQEKENQKIPLKFLCNIGLENLPLKLDAKIF